MSQELPKVLQAILKDIKEKMGDRVDVEVVKMNGRTPEDEKEIKSMIDAIFKANVGSKDKMMADVSFHMAMAADDKEETSGVVRTMTKATIDYMEERAKDHPEIHPTLPFVSLIGSSMELLYATHSEDTADTLIEGLKETAKKLAKGRGTNGCPCHGCQRKRAAMKTQTGTQH